MMHDSKKLYWGNNKVVFLLKTSINNFVIVLKILYKNINTINRNNIFLIKADVFNYFPFINYVLHNEDKRHIEFSVCV